VADIIDRRNLKLAHVDRSPCCGVASFAALLPWLSVRSKVERDEEDKVRAQNATASNRSELLTGAATSVGHPLKVRRGEVGVCCKVYKP
jgi:hypothetical protein